MQPPGDRRHLPILLSHRYKSAEVNQRFLDLIDESAVVQFEVDEGIEATSITRPERMIRDVDAFVGIHALNDDPHVVVPKAGPASATRYFKLELDIALRQRKPMITFIDRRFGRELERSAVGTQVRHAGPAEPGRLTGPATAGRVLGGLLPHDADHGPAWPDRQWACR